MIDIDPNRIIAHPIFVGILGVAVSVLKFMPGTNYAEKAINFMAGAAVVWSCAPGVIEYLSIKTIGIASLLSFMIGAFGLSLAAAVSSGIKETKFGEIITGWLSRKG